MIFNIQRFSTHDGDGIRTLIFFKGCPLRCQWCSNPESQSFKHEIMFDRGRCIACLECVKMSRNGEFVFHNDEVRLQQEKIQEPLLFRDVCPAKAITVVGEEKSLQEIISEVNKDRVFYKNSSGGVTVSGGEPFSQPVFLYELLQEFHKTGVHVSVETCLHVAWENIQKNAALIDMFLVDVKHTDAEKFRIYTGGDLQLILSNLQQLGEIEAQIIVRIPVIPGFNHTVSEMQRILDVAASLINIHEVHFLPYHGLGSAKYRYLGRAYDFSTVSLEATELQPYIDYARNMGFTATIGG